jgi:electron transfer flavoprotein beta subunit
MENESMRIAVLLKYVLDPEILARDFSVDAATGLPSATFPSFQFDPYDRIALEIALRAGGRTDASRVAAICVGPDAAQDRLRDALALKADEAVLIEAAQPLSDYDRTVAFTEWAKTKDFDVVMCGRMTSDTDSSEAGPLVAEMLGYPLVPNIVGIEMRDGKVACKREIEDGYEWILMEPPFVATATNSSDVSVSKARLQDVMRAQKKPIERMAAKRYLIGKRGRGLKTLGAQIPNVTRLCHVIEGEDGAAKALELARQLLPMLSDASFSQKSAKVSP